MDIKATLNALNSPDTTDEPTTKKQAGKIADALTRDALTDLRDWCNELDGMLERAETAADELAEADGDDRGDAYTEVCEAVSELRTQLTELTEMGRSCGRRHAA
jgi:hypothetical protein